VPDRLVGIRRTAAITVVAVLTLALTTGPASATPPTAAECGDVGPVAAQYVDGKKLCRDARREVLRSLKTGKPVDWDKVFRDSVRTPHRAGHHRANKPVSEKRHKSKARHRPTRRHVVGRPRRHEVSSHKRRASPGATTPSKRPTPDDSTTRRTPPPALPRSPTPVASDQPQDQLIPQRPADESRPRMGRPSTTLVLAAALVGVGVAFAARRRLLALLAVASNPLLRRPHPARSRTRHDELAVRKAPSAAPVAGLLLLDAIALTGPGAEAALRGLILDVLSAPRPESAEIVISRADAADLLGIKTDELVDERIPGLVLTDHIWHSITHLRTPGPRRLFVTQKAELDLIRSDSILRQRERVTAVSLSPWPHESAEIDPDGHITSLSDPTLTSVLSDRLPTLSRDDAHAQLMRLPRHGYQS
jgi:hypothetical protein